MKFKKLIIKTPDSHGIMCTVQKYNEGTVIFRPNGFVYIYRDSDNTDVWSGNFQFIIKKKGGIK
jgi:hypothetical protein